MSKNRISGSVTSVQEEYDLYADLRAKVPSLQIYGSLNRPHWFNRNDARRKGRKKDEDEEEEERDNDEGEEEDDEEGKDEEEREGASDTRRTSVGKQGVGKRMDREKILWISLNFTRLY